MRSYRSHKLAAKRLVSSLPAWFSELHPGSFLRSSLWENCREPFSVRQQEEAKHQSAGEHCTQELSLLLAHLRVPFRRFDGRVVCSPVVVNGWVYVGSWDHKLYAFSLPRVGQQWLAIAPSPTFCGFLTQRHTSAETGKPTPFSRHGAALPARRQFMDKIAGHRNQLWMLT